MIHFLYKINIANKLRFILARTMQSFKFNKSSSTFLPDPNDEEFQLEKKVDKLSNFKPREQRNLLFNDTNNYINGNITPYEEWYNKRANFIRDFAELNWIALGEYLHVTHSPSMNILCGSIRSMLNTLVIQLPRFSLPLFCSVLGKIDFLFHTLLPSHYINCNDPDVIQLLKKCGQI